MDERVQHFMDISASDSSYNSYSSVSSCHDDSAQIKKYTTINFNTPLYKNASTDDKQPPVHITPHMMRIKNLSIKQLRALLYEFISTTDFDGLSIVENEFYMFDGLFDLSSDIDVHSQDIITYSVDYTIDQKQSKYFIQYFNDVADDDSDNSIIQIRCVEGMKSMCPTILHNFKSFLLYTCEKEPSYKFSHDDVSIKCSFPKNIVADSEHIDRLRKAYKLVRDSAV